MDISKQFLKNPPRETDSAGRLDSHCGPTQNRKPAAFVHVAKDEWIIVREEEWIKAVVIILVILAWAVWPPVALLGIATQLMPMEALIWMPPVMTTATIGILAWTHSKFPPSYWVRYPCEWGAIGLCDSSLPNVKGRGGAYGVRLLGAASRRSLP